MCEATVESSVSAHIGRDCSLQLPNVWTEKMSSAAFSKGAVSAATTTMNVADVYDHAAARMFNDWKRSWMSLDESDAVALGDVAGRSVADFGCGGGGFLRACGRRGATPLLGIDASQPMIDSARREHRCQFGTELAAEYRVADCFAPLELMVSATLRREVGSLSVQATVRRCIS